jgi:hypothetical protein
MQDVTARLLAERFERASVWCAHGVDPPAWYS